MVEMIKIKANNKWDIILPKHRAERVEWTNEIGWEPERLDAEYEEITHQAFYSDYRPVVYCVGAEESDFPNLYCNWGADVVLIEPNPKVWSNIRVTFEANENEKHIVGSFVGFASDVISDATTDGLSVAGALFIGSQWPEAAYEPVIHDHGFRNLFEQTDTTPQITLDILGQTLPVYPTIITIDSEGSELQVLKGATEILKTVRPVVFVSIHEEFLKFWWNQTPQDVYDFMTKHDYVAEWLADDHETHVKFTPSEHAVSQDLLQAA